jgi:glycosyltransferase involved in cell wall biosynthesis
MAEAISPKISVVIPVFNSALTIGKVVSGTIDCLKTLGQSYEVLVIDDGSTDLTGEVAKEEGADVVKISTNKGKGSAIRTAFRLAKGEIIVTIDGDGIDDPQEIGNLIAALSKDVDIVIGSRFLTAHNNYRSRTLINNYLINTLIRLLTGKPITDPQSGYMAIKKKALEQLNLTSDGFDIETEIVFKSLKKGLTLKEIPVTTQPLRLYYSSVYRLNLVNDFFFLLRRIISLARK